MVFEFPLIFALISFAIATVANAVRIYLRNG
jgi:hypothetical protein